MPNLSLQMLINTYIIFYFYPRITKIITVTFPTKPIFFLILTSNLQVLFASLCYMFHRKSVKDYQLW